MLREMNTEEDRMTPVPQVALLTISEVAAILRVSEATAYRLRAEGAFESFPVGGQWRVYASSLREYMKPRSVA